MPGRGEKDRPTAFSHRRSPAFADGPRSVFLSIIDRKVYRGYAPASSIMFHVDRLARQKKWDYLPSAYVEGTSPADGYSGGPPYRFGMSRNSYSGTDSSGTVKVLVRTFGVMPRPVTMKVNDAGIWKPAELSSLFVDVAPPIAAVHDEL